MRTEQPKMIYLKDYQAPDYLIDETNLTFELYEDHTLVHAQLVMRRNPARGADLPLLVLDGHVADLLVVAAQVADGEIGLFAVDPRAAGVSVERTVMVDAHNAARVRLDGVKLNADARLGGADGRVQPVRRSIQPA